MIPGYFTQSRLWAPQLLLTARLLHMAGQGIVVADNNLQISLKGTLKISQFPEQLEPSNFTNQKLFWIHSPARTSAGSLPLSNLLPFSSSLSLTISISLSLYLPASWHLLFLASRQLTSLSLSSRPPFLSSPFSILFCSHLFNIHSGILFSIVRGFVWLFFTHTHNTHPHTHTYILFFSLPADATTKHIFRQRMELWAWVGDGDGDGELVEGDKAGNVTYLKFMYFLANEMATANTKLKPSHFVYTIKSKAFALSASHEIYRSRIVSPPPTHTSAMACCQPFHVFNSCRALN